MFRGDASAANADRTPGDGTSERLANVPPRGPHRRCDRDWRKNLEADRGLRFRAVNARHVCGWSGTRTGEEDASRPGAWPIDREHRIIVATAPARGRFADRCARVFRDHEMVALIQPHRAMDSPG